MMSWFSRKPTQQKYVDAAIKVATNLYLHTIPEADAPILPSSPLQFSLPDSRYRYMIFCLNAAVFAAMVYDEKKQIEPRTLAQGCLHFATWTGTEHAEQYFDDPTSSEGSVASATAYFQEFLNQWSRWPEFEKQGKYNKQLDLISTMIRAAESTAAPEKSDIERLSRLALESNLRIPTMREAIVELANR